MWCPALHIELHLTCSVGCALCHATDPWEPGIPGSPHHLACCTRPHFLLHRYLRELQEPICCRGIIFGYVDVAPFSLSLPWHPFRSTTVTNASYHALVNVFIKLHKTCACHAHHDKPFKCLKLLSALIAK